MDEEAKKEWEKAKRIEAERMKAARALEKEGGKEARMNAAFLDPENTKIKGYSRDKSQIMRSAEKMANYSLGFVILGIIVNVMMYAVIMSGGAPMSLMVLLNIFSAIGSVMLYVSPVLAIVALGSNYYKDNNKSNVTTAVVSLIIFLFYLVLRFTIMK